MSSINGAAQVRALADEILQDETFSLEGPITYEDLSIVPIVRVDEMKFDFDYLNAAEALEAGVLIITEAGDAVNTILARNEGKKPILIEEAEVLVADGSQDRIVVSSIILQPGEERRIPVKCVHQPHGLRSGAGFSSLGAASAPMRASIKRQKYQSMMTDVEHYTPETAVDQGEVWSDVAKYSGGTGIKDPAKYTEALKKKRAKIQKATKKIKKKLPKKSCGFIAVDREGRIHALELYRSVRAFWKRVGIIESLLMDRKNKTQNPLEREAAWSKALQTVHQLRKIKDEEVIVKEGSDNLVIGTDELVGEAITSGIETETQSTILYCSLSTTS
ncbi:MAG: ARPP-1 family domain-containing protein [Candidatus Thorarchaeota archaeon]